MINDTLVFSGIDGRAGDYLLPSVGVARRARLALGHALKLILSLLPGVGP